MKYLFATNNPDKVSEIKAILGEAGLEVISLADLGLSFEPTETGQTFKENAGQKARKTAQFLQENGHNNIAVLSDDSGLCIDAMDGEPGVDSANFMGRETPYNIRNQYIINQMLNVPDEKRTARFVCVIYCLMPPQEGGNIITTTGEVEGMIAHGPRGSNGFGYDPIFLVKEYGKTTAELTAEEKNKISHRGKALRLMVRELKD